MIRQLAAFALEQLKEKPYRARFHNGFLALVDQFLASSTNFLTGVIIGRACSKEQFGLYMLGLSLILLVTRLQFSLISTPFMFFYPRIQQQEKRYYAGSVLIHQILLGIAVVLFLTIFAVVYQATVKIHDFTSVFLALLITILLIQLREFVRQLCFSIFRFSAALTLDLVIAVLQIAGLMFLASSGFLSAATAFILVGAVSGAAVLHWWFGNWKIFAFDRNRLLHDLRQNWRFGRWIFLSGIVWEFSLSLYPWVLAYYHGAAEAGIWAACFGTVALANPLLLGISNFLGPKIAHAYGAQDVSRLSEYIWKIGIQFSLMVVPVSGVLVCFGGVLVALFYGPAYRGNGTIVAVLAIELIVSPMRFAFSRALFAKGQAPYECLTNAFSSLVLITIGLFLVHAYGSLGAAISILVAGIGVTLAKFVVFISHKEQNLFGEEIS